LPAVAAQAAQLARAECAEGELCAPCFDPITGDPTAACTLPGDTGPSEPAVRFDGCCEDASLPGLCVPAALLPSGGPALPRATCASENAVCAPRPFVEQPDGQLPACTSLLTHDGRCVPDCYVGSSQALALGRGSCASADTCVPCSALGSGFAGCPAGYEEGSP
jgi:hypothetical protein